MMKNFLYLALSYLSLLYCSALWALTKQSNFTVDAIITAGCVLGSSNSDTNHYGTLQFGNNINNLDNAIEIISSINNGSIVIQCTPNTTGSISLSSGVNVAGSIASGRKLKNQQSAGQETLNYQLYQNANRTTIWGNNTNGGNAMNFTANGTIQQFPIYARLFAQTTLPPAGDYLDTITATITY